MPASREERLGRGQRAGPRVENEGRTGSRRGAVRPEPGRAWRQCPPGGAVQAVRLRPPDTRCSSRAEGQRRKGSGSDGHTGPRAPSPLPTSACTPPDESRGRRPTSSSGVPPEPEPVPVLVLCSSSGFRLLMVRGVEWGRREEGNAEGERGAGPGEEAGGGAVSGALRGCRAGWRWGGAGR